MEHKINKYEFNRVNKLNSIIGGNNNRTRFHNHPYKSFKFTLGNYQRK